MSHVGGILPAVNGNQDLQRITNQRLKAAFVDGGKIVLNMVRIRSIHEGARWCHSHSTFVTTTFATFKQIEFRIPDEFYSWMAP